MTHTVSRGTLVIGHESWRDQMDRPEIIKKIQALRAKAADGASTEAEAETAIEFATRLLLKYDIKPDELNTTAKEDGVVAGFRQGKELHPVARKTCVRIAQLTETYVYVQSDSNEVRFVGLEHDVMMATYLIEMLVATARRTWHQKCEEFTFDIPFKAARLAYFAGFSDAINAKLVALTVQRQQARSASTSSALVIVKTDVIAHTKERLGIVTHKKRAKAEYVDPKYHGAGHSEGNQVNLERPLDRNATRGEIA